MTPLATVSDARYCDGVVEQPDAVVSVGTLPLVAAYSATDVLHAAMAAIVSDIFDRTM